MILKGSWSSVPSRRCLPYRLPGCSYSTPWHLQEFQNKRQAKPTPGCSGTQQRLFWGSREPVQHFGPKSRIPDLFKRKDEMHLKLATQQLEWYGLPPSPHHDMLEAVSRVGRIEERIQYTFRNKMLCVEALKVTTSNYPLFFKGMIQKVKQNNRLALLGDRVLSMVLCDMWYDTGNSPAHYMRVHIAIATQSGLYLKARKLGIDKQILIGEGMYTPSVRQIAESLEAILGAIYLDSDRSFETVKQVMKGIELDKHKFLKAPPEAHLDLQDWERQHIVYREEELLFEEKTRSLEHEAEEIQKHLRDAESSITGVSGVKPNISPEAQSAIHREAAKLEINAKQLWREVNQASPSAVSPQVGETIKRRARVIVNTAVALQREMDHSDGIVEEQSSEEPIIGPTTTDDLDPTNENPPPDEPAQDSTPETTENQPYSLTCLFPSENSTDDTPKLAISASQKSSAIPADSVLPKDSNATIIALIAEFNQLIKESRGWKMRNVGMPSDRELGIKRVAWRNTLKRANVLKRQGKSADTLAIYEDMVQKSLESNLIIERKMVAMHQEKILTQKIRRVKIPGVENPTVSASAKEETSPAKEETNPAKEVPSLTKEVPSLTKEVPSLTKEQDQNQDQGRKQKKKRLAPGHNEHRKEIGEFSESVKHSEQTVESVEDLERAISELHAAAWGRTNKTAEQAPEAVLWRPSQSPPTSFSIRGRLRRTASPFQGETAPEAPGRVWVIRKTGKPPIRIRIYPSPHDPISEDRAAR